MNGGSNNILIGTSNAVDTTAAGTNYNLNIGNLLQGDMTNSTALGTEALFLQSTASSVDHLQIAGGATGSPGIVTISGQGTDSNVNIAVTPKGTGSTNFTGNVGMVFTTPDFREAQASATKLTKAHRANHEQAGKWSPKLCARAPVGLDTLTSP